MIVLNSVLFIFSLFLIVCLLSPVQLYGSTILCDPSFNLTNLTNCDEESPSSSTSDTETTDNSQSDNTETPLIIPDISPTDKDLDDATTDGDLGTTVTDATDELVMMIIPKMKMLIVIRAIAKAGLATVKLR